jgi:hypothetical protein
VDTMFTCGHVHYKVLCALKLVVAMLDADGARMPWQIFSMIDLNGDGTIAPDEMDLVLRTMEMTAQRREVVMRTLFPQKHRSVFSLAAPHATPSFGPARTFR